MKLSLRWVIPATLMIFLIVAGSINLVISEAKIHSEIERRALRDTKNIMTRLQAVVENALEHGDLVWAQSYLAELSSIPYLDHLLLIDQNGQVIASTKRSEIKLSWRQALQGSTNQLNFDFNILEREMINTFMGKSWIDEKSETVFGVYPVSLHPVRGGLRAEGIGLLFIRWNLKTLKTHTIALGRKEALNFALSFALLAFALALALHYGVTKRLYRLSQSIKEFSYGEHNVLFSEAGSDEISDLAQEFNKMVKIRIKTEGDLLEAKKNADLANKAKSSFLANMSHELRTPLTSVIGFSELLMTEQQGLKDPKQRDYVNRIGASGRHLLYIIGDILNLAKIEAGTASFSPTSVDMAALVKDTVNQIEFQMTNVKFIYPKDLSNIPLVQVDEVQMRQIIYNLLSNAKKFTPEDGEIGLAVRCQGRDLLLCVWDTGIGVDEQRKSEIFNEFIQIESDYNRRYQGAGLGLTLVKKMVEDHGGRIEVSSQLGKGFRVEIYFPDCVLRESKSNQQSYRGEA